MKLSTIGRYLSICYQYCLFQLNRFIHDRAFHRQSHNQETMGSLYYVNAMRKKIRGHPNLFGLYVLRNTLLILIKYYLGTKPPYAASIENVYKRKRGTIPKIDEIRFDFILKFPSYNVCSIVEKVLYLKWYGPLYLL